MAAAMRGRRWLDLRLEGGRHGACLQHVKEEDRAGG